MSVGDKIDVYCWGKASHRYLFHDSGVDEEIPRKIIDFDEIFDMATLQILRNGAIIIYDFDGKISSFGNGTYGRLGHGDCETVNEPKRIASLMSEQIIMICGSAISGSHTLFLNVGGEAFGCGSNIYMQATGTEMDKNFPL